MLANEDRMRSTGMQIRTLFNFCAMRGTDRAGKNKSLFIFCAIRGTYPPLPPSPLLPLGCQGETLDSGLDASNRRKISHNIYFPRFFPSLRIENALPTCAR